MESPLRNHHFGITQRPALSRKWQITYFNREQFQFELAKARALRDLEDNARTASVPRPEDIRDLQLAIEAEFHAVCNLAWRDYLLAKGLSDNFSDSKTCHKFQWDGMTPKLL